MAVLRRSSLHLLHRHVARRYASSVTAPRLTIGIRREDPLRIWERRCPLTPDLVNELVEKDGVDVLIEDCDRRVWNTSTFVQVCSLSPQLRAAQVVCAGLTTPMALAIFYHE